MKQTAPVQDLDLEVDLDSNLSGWGLDPDLRTDFTKLTDGLRLRLEAPTLSSTSNWEEESPPTVCLVPVAEPAAAAAPVSPLANFFSLTTSSWYLWL